MELDRLRAPAEARDREPPADAVVAPLELRWSAPPTETLASAPLLTFRAWATLKNRLRPTEALQSRDTLRSRSREAEAETSRPETTSTSLPLAVVRLKLDAEDRERPPKDDREASDALDRLSVELELDRRRAEVATMFTSREAKATRSKPDVIVRL